MKTTIAVIIYIAGILITATIIANDKNRSLDLVSVFYVSFAPIISSIIARNFVKKKNRFPVSLVGGIILFIIASLFDALPDSESLMWFPVFVLVSIPIFYSPVLVLTCVAILMIPSREIVKEDRPSKGVTKGTSSNKLVVLIIVSLAMYIVYVESETYFSLRISKISSLLASADLSSSADARIHTTIKEHSLAANNLVSNPNFDSSLDSWYPKYDTKAFSYSSDEGGTKNGVLSVVTLPPVNPKKNIIYEASMTQCIQLADGLKYRFSAYFKPMGDYLSEHTNRINLIWYQSADCSKGGQFSTYLEPNGDIEDWQRIERNVTRSLNAKAVLIEVSQRKTTANNVPALWDSIELIPVTFKDKASAPVKSENIVPVGTNYLLNPEFSKNLDHWKYRGDTTWAGQEGEASDGSARLAIFSDSGGFGAYSFYQCVNLGSQSIFSFGAKVKVDPISTFEGGGILRLSWYEGINCGGRSQAGFKHDRVEYVDDWQTIGVDEIIAPVNAASARVSFTRGINDSGTFAYFIDSVFFVANPGE
jgi:hypothetical protein